MKGKNLLSILFLLCIFPFKVYASIFNMSNDSIHADTLKALGLSALQQYDTYSVQMPSFPYRSPEAAAFQKYGEFQMNEYTGVPDIGIPLYELHDRDVEIPIALSYDPSGIKTDQESTWVGLGWNLNVGGSITLVPSGQVDKYDRMGEWADYVTAYDVANSPMKSSNSKTYNDSDYFDFENGYIPKDGNGYATSILHDLFIGLGERDFFSVNVMGKHFLFFFNPYTCKFEVIGKVSENFTVTAIGNNDIGTDSPRHEESIYDYMQGFIVRDSEGNIYEFANTETSYVGGISYPSAWNLTSLTTARGNRADFLYSVPQRVSLIGRLTEQYRFVSIGNYANYEDISYGSSDLQTGHVRSSGGQVFAVEKSYLKSIETDNFKAIFQINDSRKDLPGSSSLTAISVTDNGGRILKEWSFDYSYFKGCNVGGDYLQVGMRPDCMEDLQNVDDRLRYRLRLDSITEMPLEPDRRVTSFQYSDISLPLKTSFATDFWGFYNGKENINTNTHIDGYRTSIPDGPLMYMCGNIPVNNYVITGFSGSNTYADRDYLTARTLRRITYPTKGHTDFSYEPNTFASGVTGSFPEQHELSKYNTLSVICSYNPDSTYHSFGARVDDSNVTNQYMPQSHVLLVRLSVSGRYGLHVLFRGSKSRNLRTLDEDGALVMLASHQTGTVWNYRPHDTVNGPEDLDAKSEVETAKELYLEAGWYTIVAALPDCYGANSDCIVSAWLTADFTPGDISSDDTSKWSCSTGGGVRVSSVRNYSGDTDVVSRTDFEYIDGRLLIPVSFGEYWEKGEFHTASGFDKLHAGFTLSNTSLTFANAFVSCMTPGIVGYSSVVRKDYNKSGEVISVTESRYSNKPASNLLRNFLQFDDFNNGALLCRIVTEGNDTLQKVTNIYCCEKVPITCNIQLTDRSINDNCELQHQMAEYIDTGGNASGGLNRLYSVVYSYYRIWNRLVSATTATYYNGGMVSATHEYSYNPINYRLSSDKFDSSEKDKKYLMEYKYPCDYSDDSVLSLMYSDNYVSPVTEQTMSCGGKELSHTKKQYGYRTDGYGIRHYYPTAVMASANGSDLEERLRYGDYDVFLNPRSFVKDETEKTTWLWSYGSTYPVAEISGMTYPEVTNVVGSSAISALAAKRTPQSSDLSSIRTQLASSGNPVLMTDFLNLPGVGVKASRTYNGSLTTYGYDSSGRLVSVHDNDGNTLLKYSYQYSAGDNHVQTETMLDSNGSNRITALQYFDGLGRPVQESSNGIGGNGNYLCLVQEYDGMKNICRQWLPVSLEHSPGQIWNDGIEKNSIETYNQDFAYSDNAYDALGRLTFTKTSGSAWHLAKKGKEKRYVTNGNRDVRLYTAPMDGKNELVKSGFYEQCMLYGEQISDEDGHTLTVFTDKLGRKVLERRHSDEGNNDTYLSLIHI